MYHTVILENPNEKIRGWGRIRIKSQREQLGACLIRLEIGACNSFCIATYIIYIINTLLALTTARSHHDNVLPALLTIPRRRRDSPTTRTHHNDRRRVATAARATAMDSYSKALTMTISSNSGDNDSYHNQLTLPVNGQRKLKPGSPSRG